MHEASCSTWIRASVRLTANKRIASGTATIPAPATIHSSCSTSSVTWNDVRFVPATSTAPTDGAVCLSRLSNATRGRSRAFISGPTRGSPIPMSTSSSKQSGSNTQYGCCEPHLARKDQPSADAPDWAAAERSAALLCELHLSSRELDKIPPGRRQGRMASGRTLSACRLYSYQHEPPSRARRCFLQQAWHVRTMDQRGQGCDQMDAAVMSDVRGQRGSSPASCARL